MLMRCWCEIESITIAVSAKKIVFVSMVMNYLGNRRNSYCFGYFFVCFVFTIGIESNCDYVCDQGKNNQNIKTNLVFQPK